MRLIDGDTSMQVELAQAEKMKCVREKVECKNLSQKLETLLSDYTYCDEKFKSVIENLSEGCQIGGIGIGYDSLSNREHNIKNQLTIISDTIKCVNRRIDELDSRIKQLSVKINTLSIYSGNHAKD